LSSGVECNALDVFSDIAQEVRLVERRAHIALIVNSQVQWIFRQDMKNNNKPSLAESLWRALPIHLGAAVLREASTLMVYGLGRSAEQPYLHLYPLTLKYTIHTQIKFLKLRRPHKIREYLF
jgi:hypothetical protein